MSKGELSKWRNIMQTCQVSCIWHETHALEVYLMFSSRRLKSHAFTSIAVMLAGKEMGGEGR